MAVPDDPELRDLTEQFVRVRLLQMGGVDLSIFQFDPFLSWSVFLMNGDRTIYGRYGQAHPATKRAVADSNPNHSVAALKAALRRALEIHAGYSKEPKAWKDALAGKTGPAPKWRHVEDTPIARKYGRMKRVEPGEEAGCIQCHEVQRAILDSLLLKRLPVPDNMLWLHPRPGVLGLTMDDAHCARVTAVAAGSVAAAAGVQPGDDLVSLGGQPLVSVADLQWVLHHFPDKGGKLVAEVRRKDATGLLTPTLVLEDGWRRAEDFGWRYRVAGYASWLWAGVSFKDGPDGVVVAQRSPNWFKKTNRDARQALKPGDLILQVDRLAGIDRSELIAYLIREKGPSSTVIMKVRRDGREIGVKFKVPKERPEILGH